MISEATSKAIEIAPEDVDRAVLYGFVARMLQAAPIGAELDVLRSIDADDTEIGRGLAVLSQVARETTSDVLQRNYQDIFIGVGRGELIPYASYYLTGFLHEKPLADLRATMSRFGMERAEGVSEPEDHIAAILQMMEGLILGSFGQPATLDEQKQFFASHIGPWASHFFKDLAASQTCTFYSAVGSLGGALIAVEADAFDMTR